MALTPRNASHEVSEHTLNFRIPDAHEQKPLCFGDPIAC